MQSTTWMICKMITLSERSQSKKKKEYVLGDQIYIKFRGYLGI